MTLNDDWLLMLNRDGLVEAVDGGAPRSFIARRVDECRGLPDAVVTAARQLVRELSQPSAGSLLRRVRVPPEHPGAPSFTLLSVEAILVRPEEIALGPTLLRWLDPLERQATSAGITLAIELADDLPAQLSLDADKVGWALTTLVGNALRYVRRGGGAMPGGNVRVRASCSAAQRMVSVTVHDDGPGIPTSMRPFLLAPNPATGQAAGVALRLVHEVVAAHGGGMVIKSSTDPDERGTTVTLWLPVRA